MAVPRLYMITEKYQQPVGPQHAGLKHLFCVDITSRMKWQFVVNHTIPKTEIPALVASFATNTPILMFIGPCIIAIVDE